MSNDNRSNDRKLAQLCREAHRVLAQVLPGEVDDPILAGVTVIDVRPAPDASRLAVGVALAPGDEVAVVLERLGRLRGMLRSELAAALARKRTPEIVFEVVA